VTHQRVGVLAVLGVMTLTFLGSAAFVLLGNPFEPDAINLPPLTIDEASDGLRLTIDKTGITVVTPADLQRARLPYNEFSPAALSLTRDGEPVPFYVAGEDDDARLYFYGVAMTQTMSAPTVYWLSPGQGEDMSRHNAPPPANGNASLGWQSQHWEENSRFKSETTGSDPWLGQALYAPGRLDIPLTGIRPSGGPGRLVLRVWSGTESASYPDHHLEIYLNDVSLMGYRWDGIQEVTISVPLRAGLLQVGENTLGLHLPGDTGAASDAIYVDWIKLDYESLLDQTQGQLVFQSSAAALEVGNADGESLVFDVSDPRAPVLLTSVEIDDEDGTLRFGGLGRYRTYAVVQPQQAYRPTISAVPIWETTLQDPSLSADYLAIVPSYPGFTEALAPLLELREQAGLRVTVVEAEQIYDEFAYGRQAPEAIRNFIRYARENWQPTPSFVLLVGDGSYEVQNRAVAPLSSLIPAPLVFTEAGGYVASDSWYTLLADDTPAPDIAIGRFPVRNRDQLEGIVAKTLAYENARPGPWQERAVLVADDEGRFDTATNRLAESLEAAGFSTHRLHMSINKDLRDAIIGTINQGAGLVNYSGHGNLDVWGAEGVLQNSDVRLLLNNDWLPVYTTFTSLNGQFNHNSADSLAETLLWTRNGGIVAAVAPSGRTFDWQQTPISDAFFEVLLSGEAVTLGDVLLQAELRTLRALNVEDVLHSYNLLGDPALQVYLPPRQ
jgi:hypothetical protein